ncbi:MAG: hypothetical protein U0Q11_15810 [Vicinamibacterales bacterium]
MCVEKPFAVDTAEADLMLDAAKARGLQVCVGHDQLFDPVWEDRRRFRAGEFGDIVRIDSVFGYDLSGPFRRCSPRTPSTGCTGYRAAYSRTTATHAVYRITDFMPDERPEVWAHWFSLGKYTFPTDLRVMLKGETCTASVLFSSRARPVQKVARLYGTKAVVEVNLDAQTLRIDRPASLRGPFAKLQLTYAQLKEARRAFKWNASRFMKSDIQFFGGMRRLFELFYESILDQQAPPILPNDIRRDTLIMDDIFLACVEDAARRATGEPVAPAVLTGGRA